ncbi:MAG: DNA topoisomerase 4 subunit A [Rhodobacterales bacterium]|nr:DNA topoisomerase 4 subunit A [Rhodobacterales bacterium]
MAPSNAVVSVPLHEAASTRYLNYAMSVITSRALPDVRDGLKPVQRRILYAMYNDMRLIPTGRYRKCAAVVGEVMGKYHPHGDSSIYDALVRVAQDFSLRMPLIDGQGNFGSLDGDPPAAMRYTECKLRPLAVELLSEIGKRTVDFRPNYDGQRTEPIVLPAQFPQLLVNGCEGIAVGMATRIPPHNLGEIIDACVALIDDRDLTIPELMEYVKGPDFPTGGRLLASREDLLNIYHEGRGPLQVQATWSIERGDGRKRIVIDSIPYSLNKSKLIERIGDEVRLKRLPLVIDVRDESTDDVRIVLDLKRGASPEAAMAYLFKRTALQSSWPVNLTALIPAAGTDVPVPRRLDLKSILVHWLDFRFETIRRRYTYDLQKLLDRIHILEGFAKIFIDLDEAIRIIRASEGKRDAHEKLIDHFDLSDAQSEAILELKLYRLAKLEIYLIMEELAEKRAKADEIERILSSDKQLWQRVRSELLELRNLSPSPRRTIIGMPEKQLTYDEDAYIVKEDTYVVVTRGGWLKRQSSFSEVGKIRVRDEDEVGWLFKCHTRSTVTFFGSQGAAYVMRVDDVPSTTGYGEPLQRYFSFSDGERIAGVVSHDARHRGAVQETLLNTDNDEPPPPWGIALTARGRVLRFALKSHEETSNKAGRKYARLNTGDSVFAVYPLLEGANLAIATAQGRAMLFSALDVPILRAAGKGVTGIKLRDEDEVIAFELAIGSLAGPRVKTSFGRELVVRERKFGIGKRGGRGKVVLQRGTMDGWERPMVVALGKPTSPAVVAEEPEES